jgi:hypothetical protein
MIKTDGGTRNKEVKEIINSSEKMRRIIKAADVYAWKDGG